MSISQSYRAGHLISLLRAGIIFDETSLNVFMNAASKDCVVKTRTLELYAKLNSKEMALIQFWKVSLEDYKVPLVAITGIYTDGCSVLKKKLMAAGKNILSEVLIRRLRRGEFLSSQLRHLQHTFCMPSVHVSPPRCNKSRTHTSTIYRTTTSLVRIFWQVTSKEVGFAESSWEWIEKEWIR